MARSAASSAGEPARAAASAACTRAVTWAWVVALPLTEPLLTPPAPRTNPITVTSTECMTPLVVSVLLAQRRLARVPSRTMAMQSSLVEVASACSTRLCGVAAGTPLREQLVIAGLPRGWC